MEQEDKYIEVRPKKLVKISSAKEKVDKFISSTLNAF